MFTINRYLTSGIYFVLLRMRPRTPWVNMALPKNSSHNDQWLLTARSKDGKVTKPGFILFHPFKERAKGPASSNGYYDSILPLFVL